MTVMAGRWCATVPRGFLGEVNLLSGQTVYLKAVVTEPMRYIAVGREQLRRLLFEDGPLSDTLLGAFVARREVLQRRSGVGVEVLGPRDSRPATRRTIDYLRRNRLPLTGAMRLRTVRQASCSRGWPTTNCHWSGCRAGPT